MMYIKIVSETSETRASLDCYDINYFIKLYEGLTLKDYVNALYNKDGIDKQEEQAKMRQLMGKLNKT